MGCSDFAVIFTIELGLVPGQTEVAKLDGPVLIDQDVLTLEITVEELAPMKVEKSHRDLLGHFCDASIIQDNLLLMK